MNIDNNINCKLQRYKHWNTIGGQRALLRTVLTSVFGSEKNYLNLFEDYLQKISKELYVTVCIPASTLCKIKI